MLKPSKSDLGVDPFRDGVAVLRTDADDTHRGRYDVEWLPQPDRERVFADVGVAPDDS